jgi:hypothetical protein
VARMPKLSLRLMAGLMVCGTVVEGTLFGLWPLVAWTVAALVQPFVSADAAALQWTTGLEWTPTMVAPLLLAAILAFPLIGPFLHILLVIGVGAGLAGLLAEASGLGWWTAAGCTAIAGVALAGTVEGIRRLIARIVAGARESKVIA